MKWMIVALALAASTPANAGRVSWCEPGRTGVVQIRDQADMQKMEEEAAAAEMRAVDPDRIFYGLVTLEIRRPKIEQADGDLFTMVFERDGQEVGRHRAGQSTARWVGGWWANWVSAPVPEGLTAPYLLHVIDSYGKPTRCTVEVRVDGKIKRVKAK